MISEACGGGFAITGIANATLTLFPLVELKIVWSGLLSSMRRLPFKMNQIFVQFKFVFTTFFSGQKHVHMIFTFQIKMLNYIIKHTDFSVSFLDKNIHLHFNKELERKQIPAQSDFWYQFPTVIYLRIKPETKFKIFEYLQVILTSTV